MRPQIRSLTCIFSSLGWKWTALDGATQSYPQRWPWTWESSIMWQHQAGLWIPPCTSRRQAKSFWRKLNSYQMRASHNHCQSKLHQNCSWWKFYTPKTRFWVIGEKRNSLQLAYLPSSERMDVNSLRAQPWAVWSTFVISNVGHKCSRNTRWMDTWTQSRTQEPSWVFSSLSSTSNPSFCSVLKCIFKHSFLSSSSTLPPPRPLSPLSGGP